MKILVHHIFYRPESIGNGTYTGEMCEWLALQGHSVEVVCPPPYYPMWEVQPTYRSWAYGSEVIAGVKVFRCPIWVPSKPSGLKRLLYAISFLISSFPVMVRHAFRRPDVMVVIEPSFLNALSTLLIAKCAGALAWLHVQDFEVDLAFDLEQFRGRRLRSLVRKFESWVMKRFDVVSTISGRMLDRLSKKGVADQQSVLFPNWVDTTSIYPLPGRPALCSKFGLPEGKIIALYSGTTGAKQGLDLLIDAARRIQDESYIAIVVCGNGTSELQERAKGLNNVHFLPLQPLESLNDFLNAADIHLLPQKSSAADLVMPSKLLGMIASGRPVIATAAEGTEVASVVSRCGIVVAPEDPAALANAIVALSNNPEERQRLGQSARVFATNACAKGTILAAFERQLLSRIDASGALSGKRLQALGEPK